MTHIESVVKLLKSEHDRLTKQIQGVSAALAAFGAAYANGARTRRISAAGRARIAAAQRARWAKAKRTTSGNPLNMPKKRTMSAAARKKIAAAQRARWAKVRSAKKAG